MEKVGIKTLIMKDKFKKSNYVEIFKSVVPEVSLSGPKIHSTNFPELNHAIVIGDNVEKGFMKFTDLYKLGKLPHDEVLRVENET